MKGDDVVGRLEAIWPEARLGVETSNLIAEAAAEIRRLRSELAELRAENDKLAYWNSAVAVCKDHVEEIVTATYGLCVLCDMDKLDRELAELRARGAGPVAVEGMAWREALADCAEDLEAEVRAHYGADAEGRTHPALQHKYDYDMEPVHRARKLLAAHPPVSAGASPRTHLASDDS